MYTLSTHTICTYIHSTWTCTVWWVFLLSWVTQNWIWINILYQIQVPASIFALWRFKSPQVPGCASFSSPYSDQVTVCLSELFLSMSCLPPKLSSISVDLCQSWYHFFMVDSFTSVFLIFFSPLNIFLNVPYFVFSSYFSYSSQCLLPKTFDCSFCFSF